MKNNVTVIGLTGPTGAGKSEVAALLVKAGATVIDADALAREVTAAGHPCLQKLAEAFSPSVLQTDGSLDRKALAALAFATPEDTARLNAITHPYILSLADERLSACQTPIAVIDAPLLFQCGMETICDRTLVVTAPYEERRSRIMRRDGLTEKQAEMRMNAQPDEAYYTERADDVLCNDGDFDAFVKAATAWIDRIKETLHEA